MKAWVYQETRQVEKHGKEASWYVGWIDPDGKRKCKSCGAGSFGKIQAAKFRKRIEAELLTGTYKTQIRGTWADFRKEYESKIVSGEGGPTRRLVVEVLDSFERIIKPQRMTALRTETIDEYRRVRRGERGKRKGSILSPATLNKGLRHLKAILKKAFKWGYLEKMPDFDFERESKKLANYVTDEHFTAMYAACDQATRPEGLPYLPADWWRAVLVMGFMTGWRIGDILSLRREDLDLEAGTAISRGENNKGKRDEKVKLHPVVVDHLKLLASFHPLVMPWTGGSRALYTEFSRIQQRAGCGVIEEVSGQPGEGQKPAKGKFRPMYGFHDLRRAFATMNADKMTADALQAHMRHKTYTTTQLYINMARQMDKTIEVLHVPQVLKAAQAH